MIFPKTLSTLSFLFATAVGFVNFPPSTHIMPAVSVSPAIGPPPKKVPPTFPVLFTPGPPTVPESPIPPSSEPLAPIVNSTNNYGGKVKKGGMGKSTGKAKPTEKGKK